MRPYFFHFSIEPHPHIQQAVQLAGAAALVWVFGPTINKAREKAIYQINKCNWILKKVELSMEITSELIAEMGDAELMQYRKAEEEGIAVRVHIWKKNDA
ncbi:MAG: hypothetical protein OEV64_02100 [Desulfobulbaceae bacterium]|nr:hypothetical protein [Desulfobulbaceae bacterium]